MSIVDEVKAEIEAMRDTGMISARKAEAALRKLDTPEGKAEVEEHDANGASVSDIADLILS